MFEMNEAYTLECQDDLTVKDSVPLDTTKKPLSLYFLGSMSPQTKFSVNEEPIPVSKRNTEALAGRPTP